ncbi:MAG: L-aspartate oxidase [Alphaproteobacteria bacterium]|nr:L-aspartate oxidase [Alphaproteobacteria bacterium]
MSARAKAQADILVVGAGLAGLFLALKLAPRRVAVLSPAPLGEASSSAWAQGGLAVALGADDAPDLHAADTVAAGAGLVDPVIAQLLAESGPDRVVDLLALGVPFDRSVDGQLARSLEAAHSRPRVVRVAGDLAGRAIMDALIAAARAAEHIEIVQGLAAHALLQDAHGRVRGAACMDASGARVDRFADETVLATGGVGGLYAVTTNPAQAVGGGLAMAARAGALIADAEFVQFHPTAIDIGRDPAPLATEALRGEGAKLINSRGDHFVSELLPRDQVARAIHRERESGRGAFLDARDAIGATFPERFPTVFAACMAAGLDPRTAPIPVAPGAHYHMGGVVSDIWGRATLEGLSVIGECASTGAHGANRLASNSLLEAVVFAHRAAERLCDAAAPASAPARGELPPPLPESERTALRALMQAHAGVERDGRGLAAACAAIDEATARVGDANELRAARLIVAGALAREESRGAHHRTDFPEASAPRRAFTFAAPHAGLAHASAAA